MRSKFLSIHYLITFTIWLNIPIANVEELHQ